MSKEFDIVVFGATGFTGGLIAEYLAPRAAAEGITWAIAGRNAQKLEAVRSTLGASGPASVIVADATDAESLASLAGRTRLVIAAAGPYNMYGADLVLACAEAGTDYVDLTGEADFVRAMVDAHAETAARSGARIVHCCGVDSMPSDLGVHLLQTIAIERTGGPVARVKARVEQFKGAPSGGTVASIMNNMARAKADPRIAEILTNPLSLTPQGAGSEQPDQSTPTYDEELGTWATAFVMASINRKVVLRTNALLDHRHHRELRYDEMLVTGPGEDGRTLAEQLRASGGMPLGDSPPAPGEGPDRAQREAGSFRFVFRAPKVPELPAVTVSGDMDPGYGSTSKMVAEAAITLLRDVPDLPGGSWTPASAMADALRERLIAQKVLEFTTSG
ncbi:MAG: saccharopine dehydrogenase NADP-binding domain-containing protein [Myxococcota bacterium]